MKVSTEKIEVLFLSRNPGHGDGMLQVSGNTRQQVERLKYLLPWGGINE